MSAHQPKTGQKCHCRRGVERDNCPDCEGTGWRIDFKAIRERVTLTELTKSNGVCWLSEEDWTMTASDRRVALEEQIQKRHDMQDSGQVWQWEATGIKSRERCSICGLTHTCGSGGQNTGEFSMWEDFRGNELTLAEAAATQCGATT